MPEVLRLVAKSSHGIDNAGIDDAVQQTLAMVDTPLRRVLLVPPDITRLHSGAGDITCRFYKALAPTCAVKVLPAVGTHESMTQEEASQLFPEIPFDACLHHNWRNSVDIIGSVSPEWFERYIGGLAKEPMPIEINRHLLEKWDLIISIGQVVPHEVAGMANYTKNIAIGCGGKSVIDYSHMLSAMHGIEKTLGEVDTPVRALLDLIQENYLSTLPILYVLTVSGQGQSDAGFQGFFAGKTRATFEAAAALSKQHNICTLAQQLDKVVVWLDPKKFKTTWLGNKAIYRTRLALKDDAELVVLAPGVRKFGEDAYNDTLIRKYGYRGTSEVMKLVEKHEELQKNLSVAAHLIHGSTEGRFTVKYAVSQLSSDEVEQVGFDYLNYGQIEDTYRSFDWKDGFQTLRNGESIYFISNPAVALWRS